MTAVTADLAQPSLQGRQALARWAWATACGVFASIVVPLLLINRLEPQVRPYATLPLVLMAYSGVHLAALAGSNKPRPIALTYWAFVYVWMSLAPIAQMITGFGPLTTESNIALGTPTSTALVIGSCVAYDVASIRATRRDLAVLDKIRRRSVSIPKLHALSTLAVVMTPIYLRGVGGLHAAFMSRSLVSYGTGTGQGLDALVSALGQAPALIALAGWLIYLLRSNSRTEPRPTGTVMWVIVLLAINVLVNNPISNARQWAGTVIVTLLFTRFRLMRRLWWAVVPTTVATLSVLFPYLDYFRYAVHGDPALAGGGILYHMSVKDYDASTQLTNTFSYVHVYGFDFGRQLIGSVLFFVPRSIWPGKPGDTGILIAHFIQSQNLNLSAPLWAETYLGFGVVGVLVTFALLGRYSRRWDAAFPHISQTKTIAAIDLLIPILAGYQLILLRGSLLQATGRLFALLAAMWFLCPRERGVAVATDATPVGYSTDDPAALVAAEP